MLLEHTPPDGSVHVDWLIALVPPPSPESRCVRTYRLASRPDRFPIGRRLPGLRLPDHRALYLHREGPVTPDASGDRGTITRLAVGSGTIESQTEASILLHVLWRDRTGGGPIVATWLEVKLETSDPAAPNEPGTEAVVVERIDGARRGIPRRAV